MRIKTISLISRISGILKRHADVLAAFFVVSFVLAGMFAALRVYPFGGRSALVSDLYLQYLPVMSELQRVFHEGGSIFYSFKAG